jgi:hypothetical protein
MFSRLAIMLMLAFVAGATGCGGGAGAAPPSSTITDISVAAMPLSITLAQTSQCIATVTGTGSFNAATNWTASGGTITSAGLLTPSDAGTAACTATSVENPAISASARIDVDYPIPVLSAVSPGSLVIHADFYSAQHFGISPTISANQGYATDGTNNFLFSTGKIVETDARWSVAYTNSSPFTGITIKLDHLGDGEVSGGRIYVPLSCATQQGCSPEGVAIGVYSADTTGLPLLQWADITSSGCDGSGIAVGPDNTLYVSSFFVNPGTLCLYDATTLQYKGLLKLSVPIPRIQGISFDPGSQRFAVTADNADRTVGSLYFVSLTGEVVGPAYKVAQTGELEGLDFTQGYIGYVINPFDTVYFLYPLRLTGSDFHAASQVEIDGKAQQTTYEGDDLLDAIVSAASLGSFGQFHVTVLNPAPGGGTSSSLPFSVAASD